MSGVVSQLLRGAASVIFVFSGITKIYPFTEDMARETLKEFTSFARVYPTVPLGYQPDPLFYQRSLGCLELSLGLGLLLGSQSVKKVSCGGLIFLMVGGFQTMICLKRYGMAVIPAIMASTLVYIWTTLSGSDKEKSA